MHVSPLFSLRGSMAVGGGAWTVGICVGVGVWDGAGGGGGSQLLCAKSL